MSRFPRTILLSKVLKMLDACAEGHTRRVTPHSVLVKWNDRSFPLPSGRHGRIQTAEIGTSQVRTMVRHLGIEPRCADRKLPKLRGSFTP